MGAFERITVRVPVEAAEAMRRSVANGSYESTEELVWLAVRDWLELQSSDRAKLERLRQMIDEGDASGPSIPAEQVYAELEAIIASYEVDQ